MVDVSVEKMEGKRVDKRAAAKDAQWAEKKGGRSVGLWVVEMGAMMAVSRVV